jgi:hypothetical protein
MSGTILNVLYAPRDNCKSAANANILGPQPK